MDGDLCGRPRQNCISFLSSFSSFSSFSASAGPNSLSLCSPARGQMRKDEQHEEEEVEREESWLALSPSSKM